MVTIEDHSHLGGPMGSEYTTTACTQPCTNPESAMVFAKQWLVKQCGKRILKETENMTFLQFEKWAADMGAYGVTFEMTDVFQAP
jgi:hypothetical protein